jgi:hypothetical protein
MFMKSVVLAAAPLIAAATAAHADHDVFTDMLKHPRSEDVLNADAAQCREQTGQSNFNGSPMLPSYLRCMRARSWRFDSTAVSMGLPPSLDRPRRYLDRPRQAGHVPLHSSDG